MLIYNTKTFELIQETTPDTPDCVPNSDPTPNQYTTNTHTTNTHTHKAMAINNIQYHPYSSMILSSSGERIPLIIPDETDEADGSNGDDGNGNNNNVDMQRQISYSNIHIHTLNYNPIYI